MILQRLDCFRQVRDGAKQVDPVDVKPIFADAKVDRIVAHAGTAFRETKRCSTVMRNTRALACRKAERTGGRAVVTTGNKRIFAACIALLSTRNRRSKRRRKGAVATRHSAVLPTDDVGPTPTRDAVFGGGSVGVAA